MAVAVGHQGGRPPRLAHRMLGDGAGSISARSSTSMAAASTWCSRIMRTKSRRSLLRLSWPTAWRMSGCTTASCRSKARRCRSRSATSSRSVSCWPDWPGEVLRLNMLKTHYRSPIDWTLKGAGREREDARRLVRDRGRRRGRSAVSGRDRGAVRRPQHAADDGVVAWPAERGGVRRRARTRRVCRLAPAARLPFDKCRGMEGTQTAGERRRRESRSIG